MTKTITIDMAAYERLKQVQREHESFSQIIKRVVRPPLDIQDYMRRLDASPMSRRAAAAIEEHIERRHERSRRDR